MNRISYHHPISPRGVACLASQRTVATIVLIAGAVFIMLKLLSATAQLSSSERTAFVAFSVEPILRLSPTIFLTGAPSVLIIALIGCQRLRQIDRVSCLAPSLQAWAQSEVESGMYPLAVDACVVRVTECVKHREGTLDLGVFVLGPRTMPPIATFSWLTNLWLENGCLTDFDLPEGALSHLQHLRLSWNKLTKLELPKGALLKLETLLVCNNQLQQLPEGNFPSLKLLNLYGNRLTAVQVSEKTRFPKLERLNVSRNLDLSTIELPTGALPALSELDVSYNCNITSFVLPKDGRWPVIQRYCALYPQPPVAG